MRLHRDEWLDKSLDPDIARSRFATFHNQKSGRSDRSRATHRAE
jgi:hypothetical protein